MTNLLRSCAVCRCPVFDPTDKNECYTAAMLGKNEPVEPISAYDEEGEAYCEFCADRARMDTMPDEYAP